jgi:UDP-N-acetylmuramyl pentapeptide phosphotransferase/UDP-N-acetylglucosamine-1-phosphate transferase
MDIHLFISFVNQYKDYLLYFLSFSLGLAGAWIISSTPHRIKLMLMDHPTERSSHDVPIPRGGGVGIFLAFILCSLVEKLPTTFLFPGVMLSIISFYGDNFLLSVRFRLVIQSIAALFLSIPFLVATGIPLLLFLPVLFFVVGTTNLYNFMDGIDGIAGITSVAGFGLLTYYNYSILLAPVSAYATLAICMALASLGFLFLNLPRARVFLGDVGSILLGFVFSGIVLMLSKDIFDLICLASFIFPFYADEITTMYIRLRQGENLTIPHRKHLYQLLANEMCFSHWVVSCAYGLIQLAVGLGVIYLKPHGIQGVAIFLATCFIIFSLVSYLIRNSSKMSCIDNNSRK